MNMTLPMYIGNQLVNIKVGFGTKNGYSPYLVSKLHNPYELKHFIGMFNAACLDNAIKETVDKYMDGINEVYLMTGDGQIIRIEKE